MNIEPELLLAAETSLDICSIALFRKEQLAEEQTFQHNMHLSERLIGSIDFILKAADLKIDQIDVFAVGTGPGSFTGSRIGVMTFKMLASMLNKPIVGVGSLEAIAWQYCGLGNTIIVPMLPCRRGVVYTAAYEVDKDLPKNLLNPAALTIPELASNLKAFLPSRILFCGKSSMHFKDDLRECFSGSKIHFGSAQYADAAETGKIALGRIQSGIPLTSAIELVPDYISPPPITMPKIPIPTG